MTRSPAARDGVLVIGYGSELRADDGAGPAAARRLAECGFDSLDLHQLTPELAERIAAARVVYFLDASATVAPGEISVEPIEANAAPLEHHATPAGLLNLARVAYGVAPPAWLIGMGVKSFEIGESLSREAEHAVSLAVEEVNAAAELRENHSASGSGSEGM